MSRTVSCRIPKELHEELRELCNKAGCSINDWLEAAIRFTITGSSEFDFGDKEELEQKEIPKGVVTKVIDYTGNVVLDNSNKNHKLL